MNIDSIFSTAQSYGTQQTNGTSHNSQVTSDDASTSFASSVKTALDDVSATTTPSGTSTSDPSQSGSTWDWTTTASGVSTATGPDGTKWVHIDLDQALTADDKRITGYTSGSSSFNQAAELVAEDRADGSLTGAITKDYLTGNVDLGIVGLGQRGPGISQQEIKEMVDRLSA